MSPQFQHAKTVRRGFTLVETMITAAIGVVVLTAVVSSFMAAQQMLHTAMSESEQSLAARLERERSPQFKAYSVLYDSSAAQ